MNLPAWWPVLIPFVLFVLSMLIVGFVGRGGAVRWRQFERVMLHVVGIGSLCLTGGLLFLAYRASNGGMSFLFVVLAAVFGFQSYHYLRRLSGKAGR
jgi:hypothetical protein